MKGWPEQHPKGILTKNNNMKSTIFQMPIAVLLLFSFSSATAQIVQEGLKPMSKGTNNCFYLELPTADNKLAADVWKSFMKDYKGKTKYNKKEKEYFTDDATVKDMSENTVDIYARFDPSQIIVWYNLGGAYLSSSTHPDRYPAVNTMLSGYYLTLSKELAKADLKKKEDELKSLKGDLKKLESENKGYNDAIKKAKDAIAKAEKDIEANQKSQATRQQEIKAKEAEVDAAKSLLNNLGKKN